MSDPSESPRPARVIERTRRSLGMTPQETWIGYFAVGGNAPPAQVERWLDGDDDLPDGEYRLLAQAVNDVAVGRGLDHPVPARPA